DRADEVATLPDGRAGPLDPAALDHEHWPAVDDAPLGRAGGDLLVDRAGRAQLDDLQADATAAIVEHDGRTARGRVQVSEVDGREPVALRERCRLPDRPGHLAARLLERDRPHGQE